MKPCSQVRGFGTNFHNYVLPLYSLLVMSMAHFTCVLDHITECHGSKSGMATDG